MVYPEHLFWKTAFISHFINQSDKTLLDVSYGEGEMMSYFKSKGFIVSGTEKELKLETHYLKSWDLNESAGPFSDNSFDVVICTQVLEHLSHPYIAMRNIFRLSKRLCIFSFPVSRSYYDASHINFWDSLESVDKMISGALMDLLRSWNYQITKVPTKQDDILNGQRNWLVVLEKEI